MAASGTIAFTSVRKPSEILPTAIHYFTLDAWTVTAQSRETVAFAREDAPSCLIGIVLFALGILPGLLYWIAAKRIATASVSCQRNAEGETAIYLTWSERGRGRPLCRGFKEMIREQEPQLLAQPEKEEEARRSTKFRPGRRRRMRDANEDSVGLTSLAPRSVAAARPTEAPARRRGRLEAQADRRRSGRRSGAPPAAQPR